MPKQITEEVARPDQIPPARPGVSESWRNGKLIFDSERGVIDEEECRAVYRMCAQNGMLRRATQ